MRRVVVFGDGVSYSVFVILPAASVFADVEIGVGCSDPEGAVPVLLASSPLALVDVAASVPVDASAVTQIAVPLAYVVVARGPVHAHPVAFLAGDAVQVVCPQLVHLSVAIAARLLVDRAQLWTSFHPLHQLP